MKRIVLLALVMLTCLLALPAGAQDPETLTVSAQASPSVVRSAGSAALTATATDPWGAGIASWAWDDGGAGGFSDPSAQNPTYAAPANAAASPLTITLTVTATSSAQGELQGSTTTMLTVQPAWSASTPVGEDVVVPLVGSTVAFAAVDSEGLTGATWVDDAPALPAPHSPVGPVWQFATTAGYSGPVTVVVPCADPSAFPTGVALLTYDVEAGAWQDVTTDRDASAGLVRGQTGGLGLFVLAVAPTVVPIQGVMLLSSCCPSGSWYTLSGDSAHAVPVASQTWGTDADLTQDGQRFAYVGDGVLHTCRVDGSDDVALGGTEGAVHCAERGVRWSPDGTRIAFSKPAEDSPTPGAACKGGEVWVINADGTGLHQVSRQSNIAVVSGWSPDGRSVTWWTKPCGLPDEVCAVWVGSAEGGEAQRITGPGHPLYTAYPAQWSPDGQCLAMTWDLWNEDGSVTEVLGTAAPDGRYPTTIFQATRPANAAGASWQSFSALGRLAWSPDGAQLAFSSALHTLPAPGERSDIEVYLISADGTGLARVTYDRAENAVWWIAGANTQLGSSVTVNTTGGAFVTFDTVTAAGVTTGVAPDAGPDLPAPYSAVGPIYDIATTASYSGLVTITFPCGDPAAFSGDNVALLQYDAATGTWQDITTVRDAASGLVSGQASTLGLFRLAVTPRAVPLQGLMMVSACCPGPAPGSRYLLSGDSAHAVAVPFPLGDQYGTGLSPDGGRFAYVAGGVLYTCNVDGTDVAALPVHDAVQCGVSWSPDARRIAFSMAAADSPAPPGACRAGEVWVINVDGSGQPTQLSHQSNTTTVWGWSPDGRSVIWQRQGACPTGGDCGVWVGSVEGGDAHPITGSDHPLWMAWAAGWSPDGRRIALAWNTWAEDGSVTAVLGTVAPDGRDPQPVFRSTRSAHNAGASWQNIDIIANPAAWSPDGTQLAFTTAMHTLPAPGANGDNEVYVVNADGTGLVRVTYDDADNAVWWAGPNTQPGSAVSLTICATTLTFASVTAPGLTTAVVSPTPPGGAAAVPTPAGAHLVGEYYDVATTATVAGIVTVRIGYDPSLVPAGTEATLALLRWDGAKWVDITTGVDPAGHTITGQCVGLSPLAIVPCPAFGEAVLSGGAVLANGALTVAGDVQANGNVTLNGAVTITGKLSSSGSIRIPQTATVSDGVFPAANSVAMPAIDLDHYRGIATRRFAGPKLLNGATTLTGITFVDGDCSVNGTLTGTGALIATGRLSVNGQVSLAPPAGSVLRLAGSSLLLNGDVTISGWIGATGLCQVNRDLAVTGGIVAGRVSGNGLLNISHGHPFPEGGAFR